MSGWIIGVITELGYTGIVLLMLLEAVFPPIPSELIIPFAGYSAATGALDPVLVVVSASFGSLLGMIPWYVAGRLFGLGRLKWLAYRYGRWLTISSHDIDRADRWFDRYGWTVVFFGRLLPIVRTLISVPAGLTSMPVWLFVVCSLAGIVLWNSAVVYAGYMLHEHYHLVESWLDPLTFIVLGGIVVTYLWRVVTWRPGLPP
jgi:membrane protein DedA with SNARE-associated domain